MLQLQNNTPIQASLCVLPNEQGVDTLFVVARARLVCTGALAEQSSEQWSLCEEQLPPAESDEYLAEPGQSSLLWPTACHIGKAATDIVLIGDAIVPHAREARSLSVSVELASLSKTAIVYGDRVWQNGVPTSPQPFRRMPLCYERAYGGQCLDDQGAVLSAEARNPIGLGYLGEYDGSQFEQRAVPNIEDPNYLIQSLGDTPQPVGFGALSPHWQPRASFAGTYDDAWVQNRAPYLPLDFDRRFLNCASDSLVFPGYLRGGESATITGMHEEGVWSFCLPRVSPQARARIKEVEHVMAFNLETVVLQPNDRIIDLTWRASMAAPKSLSTISSVALALSRVTEPA